MRLLLVALALLSAATAGASDIALTGSEGHPRPRFPLGVYAAPTGEPNLDAVVQRTLVDWNTLSRHSLGVPAFTRVEGEDAAQVVVAFEPPPSTRLMGQTRLGVTDGVIAVPVRIVVFAPTVRGETSRETLLYQVLAHELGHALGLPHTRDPRSLMCCVAGSVDFSDPAQRQAYIDARRHPDVASVREQLAAQYQTVWGRGK
jgi:hypothetical protein